MRSVWFFLFVSVLLWAQPLTQRYPSYRYVLSEFDIESGYIEDDTFISFVNKNEKRLKRFYRHSLQRGEGVVSLLRGELMEEGLSDLFLYLSIVESGLNSDAYSSKSAAGLWQFMPKTARAYNLDVCYGVDERCDPFSSTKAAIRHLEGLHEKFGKWYLAVMAYNCGEGRLQKAIAKAGTDEIEVLLDDRARYLPKETRDYMRKILLVAMIGEDEMIDFAPASTSNELVQVEVAGGTDLASLATLIGVDPKVLKEMNRMFPNGKVPDKKSSYKIVIPESAMARFYLRYGLPEPDVVPKPYMVSHKVVLGDTLESIAVHYGSSAEEIAVVNHLENGMLELGVILLIPVTQARFDTLLNQEGETPAKEI